MGTANTSPIYSGKPDVQWGSTDGNGGTNGALKTANTAMDGTGTVLTVFTADATNGGYVDKIRLRAAGSNVPTVARVFITSNGTNFPASNNILFDELSLPTTTASASSALPLLEVPVGFALPAGYKINIALGTTVAAGYFVSVVAGNYTY